MGVERGCGQEGTLKEPWTCWAWQRGRSRVVGPDPGLIMETWGEDAD